MDQPTTWREKRSRMTARSSQPRAGLDGLGIRDPLGVGTLSGKLTLQQIGSKTRLFIAFGGWLARALRKSSDAQRLHQTHDPLARTMDSRVTELGMDARAAVDVTVLLGDLLNQGRNSGIFSLMGTGLALLPGIIAALGNVQGSAAQLN
jgi:hypothetical protein